MKAVWQLVALPVRRMAIGCVLVMLVWLAGMLGMALAGKPVIIIAVGVATCFWYMLTGMTLRTLMRPETLLLPDLRQHLAVAGAIYAVFAIVLPVALMIVVGGATHAPLATSLLLLAMEVGTSIGLGMRISVMFWLLAIFASWKPKLAAEAEQAVMTTAWSPLLITLLAGMLLFFALRPLLIVDDRDIDESPLQAIADGRKPATNADGTPRHKGLIGKKLAPCSTVRRSVR